MVQYSQSVLLVQMVGFSGRLQLVTEVECIEIYIYILGSWPINGVFLLFGREGRRGGTTNQNALGHVRRSRGDVSRDHSNIQS